MKKILALMVVLVMLAFPIAVYAEETTDIVESTEAVTEPTATEPTPTETVPTTEEPTETEAYVPPEEVKTLTDKIMDWVKKNLDSISVIVTLILSILYQIRKHHSLNKSIGTLNNNSIRVAEQSSTAIGVVYHFLWHNCE